MLHTNKINHNISVMITEMTPWYVQHAALNHWTTLFSICRNRFSGRPLAKNVHVSWLFSGRAWWGERLYSEVEHRRRKQRTSVGLPCRATTHNDRSTSAPPWPGVWQCAFAVARGRSSGTTHSIHADGLLIIGWWPRRGRRGKWWWCCWRWCRPVADDVSSAQWRSAQRFLRFTVFLTSCEVGGMGQSVNTSVVGRRTFPDLCQIYGWQVTTVSKLSAMGQPTRPTQTSIPPGQ